MPVAAQGGAKNADLISPAPEGSRPLLAGHPRHPRHALPAIVVLGCRVRLDRAGRLCRQALWSRVEAAARAYSERGGPRTIVVASGGRCWQGRVEADVMAQELALRGVPDHVIVRERSSLTTRENARFTATTLGERQIGRAALVTSDWHVPRAVALFRRTGLSIVGIGASHTADTRWATRLVRRQKERLLLWIQAR